MNAEARKAATDYPFRAPNALDPPGEWSELRQGCPVAPVRLESGDEAVLLTRYDDVKQLLADPRFSRQLDADGAARMSATNPDSIFNRTVAVDKLGAGHQRWRRLVGKSFTAKRMSAMQPRIEAMAELLVDDIQRQGSPADLTSGLSFPLPVWVICDLLGVPDADRDKFAYWSDTSLSLSRYSKEEIDAAQDEFDQYFTAHVAAKRADPGDDMLSELITVVDTEDGRLSERELLAIGPGLLVAGHETTSNMISKMVAMLLADRRRWEELLADETLIRPAVEEALRFDANGGFGLPRYITEDVEVAGTTLPSGSTTINNISAANRDETQFDHADEMDIRRSPNQHLTFGVGPHSCLGQSLARTELQTALRVLLRRLPSLRLAVPAEELPRREGLIVGGLESVMVRW